MVLGRISHAKNRMEGPRRFDDDLESARPRDRHAVTRAISKALKDASALDFDDLLLKTVELFDQVPAVRERYAQQASSFVMVDEYQDTNRPQYLLIKQLAGEHRNLAVVGDPDQSIYKWRGADLRNILDFETDFPDAVSRPARAELPIDAGHPRRRLGGHRQQPQPQGEALWTDQKGGAKIALLPRRPTSSKRPTTSPASARQALEDDYNGGDRRCCIAPTRSRARSKTPCGRRASPTSCSAASASTSARKSRTRWRT